MRKFYEQLEQQEIVNHFAYKRKVVDKSYASDESSVLDDDAFDEQQSIHSVKETPEDSEEDMGALGDFNQVDPSIK